MPRVKILIIGAGPTGLGAALRCLEHGETSVQILEAGDRPGGLAASFVDPCGFTWDLGSHLQFSHYQKYDSILAEALPADAWNEHERSTWVRMAGIDVPYPFQHNLHRLPPRLKWDCVQGLLEVESQPKDQEPANFRAWICDTFGQGIADCFMCPYNSKIWAWPLELMSHCWIRERVPRPNLRDVLKGICLEEDSTRWGPNATFRYPKTGGTGSVWNAVSRLLPPHFIRLGTRVAAIDTGSRTARIEDGSTIGWDYLISTMPLDRLSQILSTNEAAPARNLCHTKTHVVGLGMSGQVPHELAGRCWYYLPDADLDCYRVTCLSNLSRDVAPEDSWSLMVETAESLLRPLRNSDVIRSSEDALRATGLIPQNSRIISRWHRILDHGYPIPTLSRDSILAEVLPALKASGIYSRGRFGAWKYEVSNQDHSLMQGIEAAENLINGSTELTLTTPDLVNSRHNPFPYTEWQS